MVNKFDVITIKNNYDELIKTLSNIKSDSKDNILFTNCTSNLELDGVKIKTNMFDTIFYSEDSNVLMTLTKNDNITADDIRKYLDKNNIFYSEVVFNEEFIQENKRRKKAPNICYVNNKEELIGELWDTINNTNSYKCTFYPYIDGSLTFSYNTDDYKFYNFFEQTKNVCLDKKRITGIITLKEKILLLLNSNLETDVCYSDVVKILEGFGFNYYTAYDGSRPHFIERSEINKEKNYVKKEI